MSSKKVAPLVLSKKSQDALDEVWLAAFDLAAAIWKKETQKNKTRFFKISSMKKLD